MKDVKATQSGQEGVRAYKIGKIFDMESHDQETKTHQRTTNQERFQNGKTADNRQCAAKPCHIVDLAHVEYSSQATLRRKRFHHDFMHDLRKQASRLANKYVVFTATYVVDNQPRRVGIWVWIITTVIHGTNAWEYSINHKHLSTRRQRNEHSSRPSDSSASKSLIC